MESLQEYISLKEEKQLDEELLTEDVATVIMGILAVPSVVALTAWGASWVATSYVSALTKITNSITRMWKKMFSNLKGIDQESIKKNVKEMARDPRTRKVLKQTEEKKRAFEDELKEVFSAIESKDFVEAKRSFNAVAKDIQNNPDVHKVIISEISRVLNEPPLYVTSPGNKTYKAIKQVINIRVARAAALATKMAIEKELKNDNVRDLEKEVDDE